MPLMPAMRPVNSINSTAASPISAPPMAAETGVKLAMMCLVAKNGLGRRVCRDRAIG